MTVHRTALALLALVAAALPALAPAARAEGRAEKLPKDLEGVGIDQKPGAHVPLDLRFIDENGQGVRLGDYFKPGRPVLLDLGYNRCPMLCNLVLNGVVEALKPIDLEPGKDYALLFVSIDPNETPDLARAKKANYVKSYGRLGAEENWHFLTGSDENIRKLTDAVGFRYKYIPEERQFAHSAAVFALTPEGTISRTIPGIQFEGRTLRLALAEASRGKVGNVVDQFLLYCYHFDDQSGRYAIAATRLMRAGGAVTIVLLGSLLAVLWVRERRRRPNPPDANA